MRSHKAWKLTAATAVFFVGLAGCKTEAPNNVKEATGKSAKTIEHVSTPTSITFSTDPDMLSALVRQAGPMITQGGVVLMNGAGMDVIAEQDFKGLDTDDFAEQLAKAGGLETADTDAYTFLYPKGYESLATAAFTLGAHYDAIEASAVFGEGTKIYNALAILSQSLGVTLVADNIVAEIPAGELVIRDAPLSVVVEAILRSARATPDAVKIENTDDYVFVRAAANAAPADNLLNDTVLTAADRAALEAKVSLILPEKARKKNAAVFVNQAMQLGDVLGSLSHQLGITVRADASMNGMPVNYTVLNQVTLRTAMNLLIRQWPLPKFGFEYKSGEITLRPR